MRRTRKKFQIVSYADWQIFAKEKDVRERIAKDVILDFHPPLVAHFSGIQTVTWPSAVAALHCVLSWMQSKQILTKKLAPVAAFDAQKKDRVVALLQKVGQGGGLLTEEELKELLPFTTNSSIGLSKLLHFFAPNTYPIWDTLVANVFFQPKPNYNFVRSVQTLEKYRKTLEQWREKPDLPDILAELRKLYCQLEKVPDIRLLELVLWHKGKTLGR